VGRKSEPRNIFHWFTWHAREYEKSEPDMNTTLLIDALVRQTTVLLATLATSAGQRMPLAHVATQVFADLVGELRTQGLGNKVIADMFGMALRTYHYRVARLSESETDRGHSLWEAVFRHVQTGGSVLRADVLMRFSRDDAEMVRGVLRDLVDSRLLYRTGKGDSTAYRVASEEFGENKDERDGIAQLLLVAIHRRGPVTLGDLARDVPLAETFLREHLDRLVADGRVRATARDGVTLYEHDSILIHYGDDEGWQAALFDHYQAVVTAMCTKLRRGRTSASPSESIGGSTYHFDIWENHPLEAEVLGLLGELRGRALALCERVQAVNAEVAPDRPEKCRRVTAYVGQTLIEDEEDGENDENN
jgi:hypothetical protein